MGLMGQVAKSTLAHGGNAIGITTAGLSAKGRTVVPGIVERQTANLSKRKDAMVALSDAFVTLPGGIGTFDEFFSVLSQAKVGEVEGKIALLNVEGYFNPLVQMLDDSCAKGLNSSDWRQYGNAFSSCEELFDWIEQ